MIISLTFVFHFKEGMTFEELGVIKPILKSLDELGYESPTPIQEQSIPILLKHQDLLGCAQTGTGKTAAFSIPIIQHLEKDAHHAGRRKVKALIVTPTRELAIQIGDSFTTYGKYTSIRNTVIFGGVKQGSQTRILQKGVDVLVATPGRLLDLMGQGFISLKDVEYFVLDEADQMLDMGFIHDIKKLLLKLPEKRQSLFFSATMPKSIVTLADKILGNPKKVTIQPEQTTAEKVKQVVYLVNKAKKINLLIHLLQNEIDSEVLVFSRTKHGANKIVKLLDRVDIRAAAIHGNKSQTARQKALASFKTGETKVLIATDIAARGIDISLLSYVINYDLPNVAETYVHRIGRTGRAGESGLAISFCDGEGKEYLRDIEKLIQRKIRLIEDHPFPFDAEAEKLVKTDKQKQQERFKGRGRGRSSNRGNSQNRGRNRGNSNSGNRRSAK